ncbi:MAG: hypothetical protein KA956_05155 [Pyrinomonadaceae bacterium]|nr:hypothetical protein [Acidobacteriota bacterium]MBK7933085.1 hypothetical protein [Acidobacteriota bacterium]MBP7375842.1 hypothetical protein [Pyrinomonadaceae bacterium]
MKLNFRRIFLYATAVFTVFAIVSATTPTALAKGVVYNVEQVVADGEKSKETDADLTIEQTTMEVAPDKQKYKSLGKKFAFADIKAVEYSYTKKPVLSIGGAVATALLVSVLIGIPLLFVKKKNHWVTIRTETDFAVLKLGRSNFRQILAEFETHGVKVNHVEEEKKKK